MSDTQGQDQKNKPKASHTKETSMHSDVESCNKPPSIVPCSAGLVDADPCNELHQTTASDATSATTTRNNNHNSVCFSGGAEGADLVFGEMATTIADGHQVRHYGFEGMKTRALIELVYNLTDEELQQADEFIQIASNLTMMNGRRPPRKRYAKNLTRRNYFQIKNAERVYAITRWNLLQSSSTNDNNNNKETTTVEGQLGGGTGWAVAMAIATQVPWIYLYALEKEQWYVYHYETSQWQKMATTTPPRPYGRYAGIGSRDLGEKGKEVVQALYTRQQQRQRQRP